MRKHNPYLHKLFLSGLLKKDGGFALDVGCGDGYDSQFLTDNGYVVTSVDVEKSSLFPDVVVSDIRDFYIEPGKYSFITCNNVLFFLKDTKEVSTVLEKLVKGLKTDGILHITFFGKKCEIRVPLYIEYEEALGLLSTVGLEIIERSTSEAYGTNMNGMKKYVHVHIFTCKKL